MTCLSVLLTRLWRDESGQFAFLSIIGTIPLIFLMFYTVNSGSAIQDATRSQDAADMIALVHAAEGARSMNTLAMNHVSLTQSYTTAVHASTLKNTINIHAAVLAGTIIENGIWVVDNCDHYLNWPFVGAALAAACAVPAGFYTVELVIEEFRIWDINSDYRPTDALKTASNALQALNAQNSEIVNRFPEAVSEQAALFAAEHKVTDIYFDNSCALGQATSCDRGDRRQGMELPVAKGTTGGHLHFCGAMYAGTGGLSGGAIAGISSIPGLSSLLSSASVMNGSFEQRKFPLNKGPMFGGANDEYLPHHISKTSDIGYALEDYQKMAKQKKLFDGVIYAATLGFVAAGDSTESYGGPGFIYPTTQEPEDNLFTQMVEGRVAAQCAGAGGSSSFMNSVMSFIGNLGNFVGMTSVPDFDVYHPDGVGLTPIVLPELEDFTEGYQPLAFIVRKGADRWSPVAFSDPNPGFVRYSQAITFNPDEISLYSQNWRARLIPARKMEQRTVIAQRMRQDATQSFQPFATDLESVGNAAGWTDLVTR